MCTSRAYWTWVTPENGPGDVFFTSGQEKYLIAVKRKIRIFRANLGWLPETRERSHQMARKDKSMTKGSWSKDDLKELKKLFPNRPTADVAAELGRPTEAVKKKASRMGLKKSPRYMKSLGRT